MNEELPELEDRLRGCLLGTAVGDALGLAVEGMTRASIRRRFGSIERYHLLGDRGFVSDDTEQTALVAQSLVRHPESPGRFERAFGRSLAGWFLRMPWGIGWATLRACLRLLVGIHPAGVSSAGNGAAMRAAVLGVYFRDDVLSRDRFGRALAGVTHCDIRAVDGALFVAEVAAACARSTVGRLPPSHFETSLTVVRSAELQRALLLAAELARGPVDPEEAGRRLGLTGYVVHTVPFALFCLLRHAEDPRRALSTAVEAGGDTDSIAAILGAWLGALHGEGGLPADRVSALCEGPFGASHLRGLSRALAETSRGRPATPPSWSVLAALLRNWLLIPVILGHLVRRLIPW